MSEQIFKTNPVKRILIYVISFVAVFIFTSIFLTSERFSIFYWAINILTFAVCFLLVIFEADTTIICDESGCKVKKKSLWNRSAENYDFQWSEVSETEYFADSETAREFYVETKSVKRKLITSDFSFDNLDYLIRDCGFGISDWSLIKHHIRNPHSAFPNQISRSLPLPVLTSLSIDIQMMQTISSTR